MCRVATDPSRASLVTRVTQPCVQNDESELKMSPIKEMNPGAVRGDSCTTARPVVACPDLGVCTRTIRKPMIARATTTLNSSGGSVRCCRASTAEVH